MRAAGSTNPPFGTKLRPYRALVVHDKLEALGELAELLGSLNLHVETSRSTVEALNNLDAILDVPGIDAVYVGPADLSISLGLQPASDQDDPRFNDALAAVVAGCNKRGIVAGCHTTSSLAPKRIDQGFRMLTITSDNLSMLAGAKAALAEARGQSGGASSGRIY